MSHIKSFSRSFVTSFVNGRTIRNCLGTTALLGLTFTVAAQARPIVGRSLADALERRFERVDVQDWRAITGLIVLGGNTTRATEAVRLATLHPHLRIVLNSPGREEARIVREASHIAPSRVIFETQSTTTFTNALHARQVVWLVPGEQWLLVTSALHMPRAIGSFRAVGFPVSPWPVTDTQGYSTEALLDGAGHEWVGLLAYRLRGRSAALFPGPVDREAQPAERL